MCRIADVISPFEGIETELLQALQEFQDANSPLEGIETRRIFRDINIFVMQLARQRALKQLYNSHWSQRQHDVISPLEGIETFHS